MITTLSTLDGSADEADSSPMEPGEEGLHIDSTVAQDSGFSGLDIVLIVGFAILFVCLAIQFVGLLVCICRNYCRSKKKSHERFKKEKKPIDEFEHKNWTDEPKDERLKFVENVKALKKEIEGSKHEDYLGCDTCKEIVEDLDTKLDAFQRFLKKEEENAKELRDAQEKLTNEAGKPGFYFYAY